MNSTVKVVAFNDGSVVKQNERKPNKGYFRVMKEEMSFSSSNANFNDRYATVSIDWDKKDRISAGMEIAGKIVHTETLEPAYEGQPAKRAGGDDAPICMKDGNAIYRTTTFEADTSKQDTLIAHTNGEEIKAFNAQKVDSLDLED
jgi:hypothetical protein